jgi:dTDP-4-dehydrorhamnose reductase
MNEFIGQSLSSDKPRIIITGANGMLGKAFVQKLELLYPELEVKALARSDWDVTNPEKIAELSSWVGKGWIIHCAALVNVEGCAKEPDLAREVIVGGTSNVVKIAAASGARILYPQTFLIYDGADNPITEETPPYPLSLYSSLKLAAEGIVRAQSPNNLIVRMAGFFGGEEKDKNFVGKIIPTIHQLILSGQKTFSVGDRIWQPTYTSDLATNCLALMNASRGGIYVMSSHGEASFWELTNEITALLGWTQRIEIMHTAAQNVASNELGKRPDRAVIENRRLAAEGLDLQRTWRDSLAEYLESPFFDTYRFN